MATVPFDVSTALLGNPVQPNPTQPNPGPSVLVIDDYAPTVEAYSTVLRLAGFATATALTGQNGVELAAMMRIDVALIDLNLPDQRGVDVVRELRALGCGARNRRPQRVAVAVSVRGVHGNLDGGLHSRAAAS